VQVALVYDSAGPKPLEGVRILTVDDEPDGLEALSLILRLLGAEVETASSTAWAMSKLQGFQPNVLIADLQMPGQDGFALIAQLRARPIEEGGRIPAVAFSAHDSPETRAKAFHAGFQEFLSKPTSISQILSALQGMIAN